METKIKKNENWEKRARLGTKMRYFKIPLCRIFHWKSGPNGVWMQSQTACVSDILGQKLGYDRMDLKLVLHRTIIKSGKRSMVKNQSFKQDKLM